MSIPGFDSALTSELMNWRKQQESRFVFDEQKGVSASDVQGLIHTFQPKIRPVERELLIGIEKLHAIQQKVFKNRVKFQPVIEKSARDLARPTQIFSIQADRENLLKFLLRRTGKIKKPGSPAFPDLSFWQDHNTRQTRIPRSGF